MVNVTTLSGIAVTRQKDITNTGIILSYKTTVMATTRVLEEADLVDNGNVKIRRGGVVSPAIVRDD